jgi:hypothetical protein
LSFQSYGDLIDVDFEGHPTIVSDE